MSHNYVRSPKQLYEIASRVLAHDNVTPAELAIVEGLGLITYELDIDGYYPSPTDNFIELLDIFEEQEK